MTWLKNNDQSPQWLLDTDLEEWDAFVATSPSGNPYSKSYWLKAFREVGVRDAAFRILVTRNKAGSIASGVALCVDHNRVKQPRVLGTFAQYSSYIFAPSTSESIDRILRAQAEMASSMTMALERAGFESIRLIHHPEVTDVRSMMWQNWIASPAYTFIISLSALTGLNFLMPSQRKQVNKAVKEGFQFNVYHSMSQLEDRIIAMLKKTFIRQKLNINDLDPSIGGLDGYYKFLKALSGTVKIRVFEAVDSKGTTAAMRVVLLGEDGTCYDWLAGNDPEYNSVGASSFLVYNTLMSLKKEGMKKFDFGGANTQKIADFKQAFNGNLVCGFQTSWKSDRVSHKLSRSLAKVSYFFRSRR